MNEQNHQLDSSKSNGARINMNIDQDKIDAKFCDQVLINMSAFGFTFDFIQNIPQMQTARVLSRIGMSPQHAKIFNEILSNTLKAYENQFGEIKLSTQMKDEAKKKIGFNTEAKVVT